MEKPSLQAEPQTNLERVALVERVILDVREGRITKTPEVHKALEPLGSHFGPFGCTSLELGQAIEKLRIECRKKNIRQ
jgi:hypothetical protein